MKFLSNKFFVSILIPLSITVFAILIAIIFSAKMQTIFFIGSFVFAISSKFFDWKFIDENNKRFERKEILIHKEYALNDIESIEISLQDNLSPKRMSRGLKNFERKLLYIYDCCEKDNELYNKINDLRGNVANFRTQLMKPKADKDEIYNEIRIELKSLRHSIEELRTK